MTRAASRWLGVALIVLASAAIAAHMLPRAYFHCDDYRYFSLLRDVDAGRPGALLRATIIENRWDSHWWIEDGSYVRFFRPLLIAAFAIDRAIWGETPTGFALTNIVLHAIASIVAFGVLRHVVGRGFASLLGALAFTVLTCRMEQIYFAAGRNDTIAGLLFFLGLWLFLARRESPAAGRGPGAGTVAAIAAAYAGALLSKEYCVVLPLWFVAADRLLSGKHRGTLGALLRRRARLYLTLAAVLLVWLAVRALALGEAGSGSRPFPYFFMPDRDGFVLRTVAVWLHYSTSLVTGAMAHSFLSGLDQLLEYDAVGQVALSGLAVPVLLALGWRTPAGRWCVLLFLVMLLPLLPIYSSGRYLYIATLGWCGILGLVGHALCERHRALAVVFGALVLLPQIAGLWTQIAAIPKGGGKRDMPRTIVELIRHGELDLTSAAPIYLVDCPLRWIDMQFVQAILDVLLPSRPPRVEVLCRSPRTDQQGLAVVRRVDAHTIDVVRPHGQLYVPEAGFDFDQRRVKPGDRIRESGYTVEILEAWHEHAKAVRVRFDRPLAELQIGLCEPIDGKWGAILLR